MIFNWIYGTELEMEAVTKTYSDITEYSIFHLPLTVSPLAVILRTSAGDDAELCTYYRADQNGDFTLRVSQGSCPVSSRMYAELEETLMLTCSGGTAALPATLESITLGVKR